MKRILVPTDFSKEASNALNVAIDLASISGGTITLLHIAEYPVGTALDPIGVNVPTPYDGDFLEQVKKNSREKLEEEVAKINKQEVSINYVVDWGNPFLGISQNIADNDVDIVVMGSKGATGFRELLIGSNAEKVIRHAKCPVLTVKKYTKISEIKSIVFPNNLSDGQEVLIEKIKQLQDLLGAKLHIVRINTPNNFKRDLDSIKLLNAFAEKYMFNNYTVNVYNAAYEDEGVIHFAEKIKADMIALGTHGRTGLQHLISGSIAEDIVNHAQRPIWTLCIKKIEP